MDRASERETRDLMSVESFSQLPFIRSTPPPPPPLKDKDKGGAGAGAGGIRLFGQEFGNDNDYNNNDNVEEGESNKDDGSSSSGSSKKFECHYCCRNFPTSQALGGHQNAHKRERQQAKRAHLQSAMLHGGVADPHAYALINYSRPLPVGYHSWSSSGSGSSSAYSRIYGGYGAQQQPINGSPLAFWRVPAAAAAAAFDRPTPLLGFGNREEMMKTLPLPLPLPLMSSTSSSSASKAKMQELVSLDLHL